MPETRRGAELPEGVRRLLASRRPVPLLLTGTLVVILLATLPVFVFEQPYNAVVRELHPDGEKRVPAIWSAFLLVTAGALGISLARRSTALLLFGLGLVAMSADELLSIHERLEGALDTDWQVLYAPVVVLAGLILAGCHRALRHDDPRAVRLVGLGIGAWFVSQLLEMVQWDGDRARAGYEYMMFVEECLEMLGTLSILVGLLIVVRRAWTSTSAATASRAATPVA